MAPCLIFKTNEESQKHVLKVWGGGGGSHGDKGDDQCNAGLCMKFDV